MGTDIPDLPCRELAAVLRRHEVSAAEALTAILERADSVEDGLNPFSVRLDERARASARAADALLARGDGGPLTGVPVTVKDSQYLAGVPSAVGSRARTGYVPSETSAPVARMEEAGAVIFAKTATPEFCYSGTTSSPLHGPTRNPWNLARTPGGSSGGAAAAVAVGAGPVSLGGDGGGSIRIPAAFCGVVGFKPTFGVVPREPSAPGWKSLVSVGPLTRTVDDARLVVGLLAGFDARDRHSFDVGGLGQPAVEPQRLRIAVSDDLGHAPVDDDVRKGFWAAVERLAGAGVDIFEDHPDLPSSAWIWGAIATAEARWAEAEEYEHKRGLLDPESVAFQAAGEFVSAGEYIRANFERETIHRAYVDFFARNGAAVLLTPTMGLEAFELGRRHPERIGGVDIVPPMLDWAGFLYDANLAGMPACAIPAGIGDDGLPLSLQLLGPRCSDGAVLAAAETAEHILGGIGSPPLDALTIRRADPPLTGDLLPVNDADPREDG